ncbi:UNVERIFIED_CONTAM: hypothetical protein GTU68_051140 [Idotea baltica]|nr:hypothetical protein [Idotea baltica]
MRLDTTPVRWCVKHPASNWLFVVRATSHSTDAASDVGIVLSTVKEEGEEPGRKGKPRLEYEINQTVRVKEGPFADFEGQIAEINEDQLKLKVLVNIFGRETPVELDFAQVGKV